MYDKVPKYTYMYITDTIFRSIYDARFIKMYIFFFYGYDRIHFDK